MRGAIYPWAALGLLAAVPLLAQTDSGSIIASGLASFYGKELAGGRTASGEIFDPEKFTAAHRTLRFGSKVRVTNLSNGRDVIVRINDRGPFHKSRIIDISHAAARKIAMHSSGTARVQLELLPR